MLKGSHGAPVQIIGTFVSGRTNQAEIAYETTGR
jgi:hypothetical protein